MQELLQHPYFLTVLGVGAGLLVLCLILLFVLSRRNRDVVELQQDLNKNINDYNQLVDKFDNLSAVKSQQDLAVMQLQTKEEYLNVEIAERERIITKRTAELDKTREILTALQQELARSKITLAEKEKSLQEQQQTFTQSRQQLSVEFQNLANRILEEKSQSFSQSNQQALDSLLKPFREQIESFQKRVNEVHSESVKGNTLLESELKKVLEIGLSMSQQANNLTSALKGEKKTLGNWGEIQLERTLQLAGLVNGDHYSAQAHFKDEQGNHNYPDFVVHLPDNKHLIIDSKMSLVAYENAVNAEDELQRSQFMREHIKAIRNHINDLSQKDYSNLIGMRSPNFVLMFFAVEPAYIEAMKADVELFNFAYQKNVILVSHTTLMPILRTVANLWRVERGNAEAKEISEKAGDIYNQICLLAERLARLGGTLATASSRYNDTVTALVGQQGLVGKVERFKDLSAKVTKTLPNVELLHQDIETEKLLILKENADDTNN
ncbi:DNA recombination protein RmuC [Lonepinella koalarum]|uniref:DNA recombination protein RmuC n=1 Tax=Lonepinella koalarum TaxID=53417 RepID=A0A4R1L061_9PAST|nr:DNA recombination protein RmuC [Lonepinella koalarum]MDH2926104.1 recombinase RmuC [Lonepinella koalarum]TCK71255.1 DNA recombination protein RmuC [Lonepinella koalarum]TFJ90977.1 DNA recombination protein RmuC [Lonepinella koalarum]